MLKASSVIKEFGPDGLKVTEEVAKVPSLFKLHQPQTGNFDIFCLRIDADKYDKEVFSSYYPVFEKYREALTIFFNAHSFRNARDEIVKCRDMGIDVQSHSYYHHVYNDYRSNRYNIRKAKDFFNELNIDTIGFTAPMGKWNRNLAKALEDEGYKYSSDFSYDYLGLPSYPRLPGRNSNVLEIPVFPIAPELFWQRNNCNRQKVVDYYKLVIDEMINCSVPVIIYAHTSPLFADIPALLESIADYAVNGKGLKMCSMTGFFDIWMKRNTKTGSGSIRSNKKGFLAEEILGKEVRLPFSKSFKAKVKKILDFERITPEEELQCGGPRKMAKLLARKML